MIRPLLYTAALLTASVTPAAAQAQAVLSGGISLPEAIARGRHNGVQAALAHLSSQAIGARQGQRGADLLPSITASASAVRQTINLREFGFALPNSPDVTDPFTVLRARVGVSQLLFDAATLARLRAAKDTTIAADFDADRAGELAGALAGAAWLRLMAAEETVRAREQDSVTALALVEMAGAQVAAGTAPRIDRTRSETQAAAVRNQIAVARNARDRARLDLARALDLPPSRPIAITGAPELSMLAPIPDDGDAAVGVAQIHRRDLSAERQRERVLRQNLVAIRREFIPSVAASGYLQTSGQQFDGLARTWSIGVGLNWPIFDGFRRERRQDEQRIRLDAEQLRLHDLEAQIEADARQAVLDVASARLQVSLATDQLRLAEQELSEAQERFSAGVTGSVETTTAQAQVSTARDALIQARVGFAAAQVSAARALGLLYQAG